MHSNHVAADVISFAATFFIQQKLSECNIQSDSFYRQINIL